MSAENENIETLEVIEEPEVLETEEFEDQKSGFGKIALASLLVIGGAAAIGYKFRNKFEERQVEKLRKKGYLILEPEPIEDEEDVEIVEEESDESDESEEPEK